MELCKKILKDDYKFVLATHIDRGHIHNHIIFNNVNYKTGKCYQSNKKITTKLGNVIDISTNKKAQSSKGYEVLARKHNIKTMADSIIKLR